MFHSVLQYYSGFSWQSHLYRHLTRMSHIWYEMALRVSSSLYRSVLSVTCAAASMIKVANAFGDGAFTLAAAMPAEPLDVYRVTGISQMSLRVLPLSEVLEWPAVDEATNMPHGNILMPWPPFLNVRQYPIYILCRLSPLQIKPIYLQYRKGKCSHLWYYLF